MGDLLGIFISAIFVDNLALAFLLGMCTFLAVSRRVSTAVGLGIAVVVVQTITVPVNYLIFDNVLKPGALAWLGIPDSDLTHLRLISFIGVIAALIQILEMTLDRFVPALHQALGIFLPLLTVNCAVLGASLFMVEREYGLAQSTVYGAGAGVGWAIAIILFAAIRERLHYSDIPEGLQGLGLAFVVTGLLSLGFAGLSGLAVS